MGIAPKFSAADVRKMVNSKLENVGKVIESKLIKIAGTYVKDARLKADFTDRTGNLRSSIGGVVLRDGVQIWKDMGSQKESIDLQNALTIEFPHGYVLIVVAGMEYAAAVESKGFDVITGSSLTAIADLKKHFKKR